MLQYIVGRPKEYFGDVWKDIVKTFPGGAGRIDKIPYMQTMMDVHSKMLRKAIGRPWNFNEVSRASKNALKVFDTVDSQAEIFAHFARSLKDVNMDFGYFTHMFPKKDSDSFFRTWNAILKTYPQLTSFLPYRLPVQYEDLNNRAKALASYWEKLENQDLRYFFVQNMEDFNALVWDIVKTRNIPERKEKYGSLGAEKGLSKFYKDYEVNKPSLTHSLNNEVRVRWIEENIRQVNSYLSERFSLVA